MNISKDGVSGPLAARKPRRNKKATQVNIQRMCEVPSNKSIDEFSLSADGRYVAFATRANNLVEGDTNATSDIFVHDRETGQTSRVSVDSQGNQSNGSSKAPSISADGRYVTFESHASNLVEGDANGNESDIFVHDRETGRTSLVSIDSQGLQGNSDSIQASISADGRYVAFTSDANNLVPGDTNRNVDVFVHDRQTAQTTRVSLEPGGAQAHSTSAAPSISADGRYVAFESSSSTLYRCLQNVFIHDRETGKTTLVSGTQNEGTSGSPSVSADGRYVAFAHQDRDFSSRIFVYDQQTQQSSQISIAPDTASRLSRPSISADGRYIACSSGSLVTEAVVFDRQTERVSRVSETVEKTFNTPQISADGSSVCFISQAPKLDTGASRLNISMAENPLYD